MIEKLSNDELEFLECLYNPLAMAESLFSDVDNLSLMQDEKLSHIRLGQIPLLSHEYLLDEDPELSLKENFQLRKRAGDIYSLGGRLYGKTLCVEKIDVLTSMPLLDNENIGFSSYDALHIEGVLEEVFLAVEQHPFFQIFEPRTKRSPYIVNLKNGYKLIGINMNITGKKPGAQFFQKHFNRLYIEEGSFETQDVFKKRRDSISELGCIFRISGMTDFTKYSPCGQLFYDLSKKPFIVNLPQYINPNWDEKERLKAIKDFNGEQSVSYRIFIKGEVVEDAISVFDMERIRRNYKESRKVKNFEVSKETFLFYENDIYVERPSNVDNVHVFADIGESAPTEIGIVFEINSKYRYVYNITLYNLTDKEQFKIFKWLIESIGANFVSIDCTDGTGRAIFRSLAEVFPKENLIWVAFNEKLPIAFEKDEEGNLILKNGQPVYKEEYVSEWSIKHLKDLLYGDRMELPEDYKLDSQLNSVKAMKSGTRVVYECVREENHLFQAFQVFSIAHWYTEFLLLKPINKKTFYKGGV